MTAVDPCFALSPLQQQRLDRVQLPESWKKVLTPVLVSDAFASLREFLKSRQQEGAVIYPPGPLIFNALNHTPLERVSVVIVGQDPYHGPRQANGLAFSVQRSIALPPSLKNIFHELATDLRVPAPVQGDLTHWADQGVLLLNSVLTVEAGQPTSHQGKGWETFTDAVIEAVNAHTRNTVFILWGSYAQKKGRHIDTERHLVLTAAHPSPLSANRGGFFGCRVFSRTNQYLLQQGKAPIDWALA